MKIFFDGKVATYVKGGTVRGKNRRVNFEEFKTSTQTIYRIRTKTLQDRSKRIIFYQDISLGVKAFDMLITAINEHQKDLKEVE